MVSLEERNTVHCITLSTYLQYCNFVNYKVKGETSSWPPLSASACVLRCVLTLCDPTDCSPPSSSAHGILQAQYWSGLPFPPPGDLPAPGTELGLLLLPTWQAGSLSLRHLRSSRCLHCLPFPDSLCLASTVAGTAHILQTAGSSTSRFCILLLHSHPKAQQLQLDFDIR